MVRLRVMLAAVFVLWAAAAQAQYTGMVTGHIGVASGGDVRDKGGTPGASIVVLEEGGVGAELDLGHVRRFNEDFAESGITSFMLNVIGMLPGRIVQPHVVAGVGLLRTRAAFEDGFTAVNRTDWGFDAGGGVLYMFNDAIGVRGDVRYFRYFERHQDLPLIDSGFFDFWRTSIGITYAWPIR